MDRGTSESHALRATYTASQIAEILGISVRKAYEICETTTDFKTMRLGKRCVSIHKESFDKWFDEQFGDASPGI
mgnify:CR=1 FL=1